MVWCDGVLTGAATTREAIVTVDGEEKFRSTTPDAELEKAVAAMEAASPGLMPYFYLQVPRRHNAWHHRHV